MKAKFILLFLMFSALLSQAQMRYFHATLQGSQEVPPSGSTASGVVLVAYDMASNFMRVYGDYQDLSSAATAAHVHGPAPAGSNADVLFALTQTGGITGTLIGSSTLSDANETELLNGNLYVNVHNANFPGGEIRGQIVATHPTNSYFFNGRLQGAQEVPPNGSTASGNFSAILDVDANIVYLTGSFSGLASNANGAHIHNAAPNTNGGVAVPLTVTPSTSGTVHVISGVNDITRDAMLNGNTYVNIHNTNFPNGEIRGQVTMLSQYSFFRAKLSGAQQVPANASTATGHVILKLNNSNNMLELVGDYQGLTAAATAAHIHGPAATGVNTGVVYPLTQTGGTSGVLTLNQALTTEQVADLKLGLWYVNVHNSIYPDGEIRGQLTGTSAGETQYFKGVMTGAQEVGPVTTEGMGNVTVLLDKATREVTVTGNFLALSANASAAHVHRGQAGVNGPVFLPLSVTPAQSGTITGSAIISQALVDSMIMGFSYVNVHNANNLGGEIRAQLGNQVLPVRLSYFNGYRDRNQVSLIWESALETDLKHYEIEQQDPDGGRWIKKATIMAGNLASGSKYRMDDVPLTGNEKYVIYRLKMVDRNGGFVYSNNIKINFGQAGLSLTVLSNPINKGVLRYTVSGLSSDKKAEVSIFDYNGRLMMKTAQSALSTNNINVTRLAPGMYKLVVRVDGALLQQSFVK